MLSCRPTGPTRHVSFGMGSGCPAKQIFVSAKRRADILGPKRASSVTFCRIVSTATRKSIQLFTSFGKFLPALAGSVFSPPLEHHDRSQISLSIRQPAANISNRCQKRRLRTSMPVGNSYVLLRLLGPITARRPCTWSLPSVCRPAQDKV